MLDAQFIPVLPDAPSPAAVTLRRLLIDREPSLIEALLEATRTARPTQVSVERLQAACFKLSTAGILVLARELATADSAADCCRDLELIGRWLTSVIDARRNPSGTIDVETYRIASLQRILTEVSSRGSVRKAAGAFVEVLGVWDNVRAHIY